jgi:hypothetical protein
MYRLRITVHARMEEGKREELLQDIRAWPEIEYVLSAAPPRVEKPVMYTGLRLKAYEVIIKPQCEVPTVIQRLAFTDGVVYVQDKSRRLYGPS